MKQIMVLYHNDHDGFGAAWAAWKKFGKKADYLPIQYQDNKDILLEKLKDKKIYLLDLCFDAGIMTNLLKENKRVVVIDHHISSKNSIKISTEYCYNIKHSGCVLSWKYFFPKKSIPKLLLYVEDMDIWKWSMSSSREINSFLGICDFDFKEWDKLAKDFNNKKIFRKYIEMGKAILKYKNILVKKIIKNGEDVIFEGHQTIAVNSPVFNSEIGHLIANKKGIGIIWNYENGILSVSLRSDGKTNVSKIAQKYDGGGHRAASGFEIPIKIKFPWKKIK